MSISIYNIKKWSKMITGKSILHVNQGIGKLYCKDKIRGYYNDLTEKITKDNLTAEGELPKYPGNDGVYKIFPIGIFQYGLGAYDLYLQKKDETALNKFKLCVDWTYKNQDANGGWKTFEYENSLLPYSAMAQGEAISLLSRAFCLYKDDKYLESIEKGISFLMTSIDDGGVSLFENNNIYLKEFVDKPVVLNGWIFSIFGLFDYLLINKNNETVKQFYRKTIDTLKMELPKYDLGYWSKYDLGKTIASPFYHKLHSAQLQALGEITGEKLFIDYAEKFSNYSKKKFNKRKAFVIKAFQKIREK